jgi:hypothetical protein
MFGTHCSPGAGVLKFLRPGATFTFIIDLRAAGLQMRTVRRCQGLKSSGNENVFFGKSSQISLLIFATIYRL